jgi:tRNA modification GTPase
MLTDDTIAAISTPAGEAAVAVIRISGPNAEGVLRTVFRPCGGVSLSPRRLVLGEVVHRGEVVDSALAAIFPCPRSYTGETMAEIHGHGGILVSARVMEAIWEAGARAAEPGEFTRRAFLNGKLDLTQAEAVMDVIRARTPLALRAAREQLNGRLGREIVRLREHLLALVANLEAWIDFPDEDIDPETDARFLSSIEDAMAAVESLLATADAGRVFRHGIRTVLCGAPNAGKSSLLNRLLGFDRAIVTATPGTTRDTIEELANFSGYPFQLTDTAGLRDPVDEAECLGIDRAKKAVGEADIIIRVVDATEVPTWPGPPADSRELLAWNKIDLMERASPPSTQADVFPISCETGEGIQNLVDALVARARAVAPSPTATAINARHQACLQRCHTALGQAKAELALGHPPELAASGLHDALEAAGEIVGIADTEEILGAIFSRFCIGK